MPRPKPVNGAVASQQRGFTLLEVLVVMTLLAVLISIVVLRAPRAETALISDARQLSFALDYLVDHAVFRGLPQSVVFERDTYTVEELQRGTWVAAAAGSIPVTRSFKSRLRVTAVGVDGIERALLRIVLPPSGRISIRELLLHDTIDNHTVRLALNENGRFAIQ